ncbi:MAG: glycoside hydrolase family 3 C-terminal domain-containing protein, partial [Bacteroidetes bacterium]|nr:glycoside hydrolase family 3 C-terminal domain-containing protein [Bacteroidota bacterium]
MEIDKRVDSLMARMTLADKIRLLSGNGHEALHSIEQLGIRSIRVSDATVGVVDWGPSTAYPAASCLSSTWDVQLAYREGRQIGIDARAKKVGILLGPGINILREPQNGRSFEYIGGEDPFLASQLVVPYIQGLQSEDVAACVKHYVGNEIETQRPSINCIISRRALEEIYLPPFRAAILQGHAWAAMTACNRINGQYGSENSLLLTDILRKRWDFQGLTMSDWGCVYDTRGNLEAGLDLEMPATNKYSYASVMELLHDGRISTQLIDEHVKRILRVLVAMGFVANKNNPFASISDTTADEEITNQVAAEGTVLLKNRGNILPLNPDKVQSIVFVGPWSTRAITGGGGSSHVTPSCQPVTLYEAVRKMVGPNTHITTVPWNDTYRQFWRHGRLLTPDGKPGVELDYYANGNFSGKPVKTIESRILLDTTGSSDVKLPQNINNPSVVMMMQQAALGRKPFSAVWKAKIRPSATGQYSIVFAVSGSGEVYLNGRR